jgi:hypothetical protein
MKRGKTSWPLGAIALSSVLAAVILVLAALNIMGLRIGSGTYNAQAEGSLSDWVAVVAAFAGVPVAVWISGRQLRVAIEQLALQREQWADHHAEQSKAHEAEVARLREAVVLTAKVSNVIDDERFADASELEPVKAWRVEMRQRQWRDSATNNVWTRGTDTCSTAELLRRENSPMMRLPWIVLITAHNISDDPVTIRDLDIELLGVSAHVRADDRVVGGGQTSTWRVPHADGSVAGFSSEVDAATHVARATARVKAAHVEAPIQISGTTRV